ncbi:hypothetical protein BSKO_07452 [Bryopsis sp. KO-2023]|nr:hypothetical protein BSKO_07452 [Bryopsis sp. KO-2023]
MTELAVAAPTHAEISANPREHAILGQLQKSASDAVSKQELVDLSEKAGDPEKAKALAAKDSATFPEFVTAFQKDGQKVEGSGNCLGIAARSKEGVLAPWKFDRRKPRESDVVVQIVYSGMCHSDYHSIHGEWDVDYYFPMVPGHEIVGIVTEVGSKAAKFKVGQRVGVGVYVEACLSCKKCEVDAHPYCDNMIETYNTIDSKGERTYGGYSTQIVVDEKFAFHIPSSIDFAGAAPLLCAGITVYSPLKFFGLDKPGMKVGVLGLGGLGHMTIKFLKSFGCHVTVISRSTAKEKDARENLKVDDYIASSDTDRMQKAARSLDGIVDCVSALHDPNPYISLLGLNGKFVVVSLPAEPLPVDAFSLVAQRISMAGSAIGGLKETQEMLDYCGEKSIWADVEVVRADQVNEAMERMLRGDVKYRFVIDVQGSLLKE